MTSEDQEKQISSKPDFNCLKWINNNITSVLACIVILAVVSLLVLVSILTWAYVRHYQSDTDLEQLHEPTQQQLFITTASLNKPETSNLTKKYNIIDDSEGSHILRSSVPISTKNGMQLFIVHAGLLTGGVCLDGSPPAYYLRTGKDLGINRWIIHFNGGAWCFDEGACLERSKSSLGSTKHLPPSPPIIEGINSPDPQVNPDFYDWNLVWVVYCDGASFTGNRVQPVTVDGQQIYFRGKKVLDTIIDDLISKGMGRAERVILTGSSAGSMTAMFAIDYLGSRLPNTPVHALSDAGFFLETAKMGGKSVGAMFKKIFDFQNSSSGLDQDCVGAFGPVHSWQCFLPEHTFKFINQPVFILNAAYDVWALIYFRGINCKFPTPTTSRAKRSVGSFLSDTDPKRSSKRGDYVLKHRDISGFEILPFFRPSSEDRKTIPFYSPNNHHNKSITSIRSSVKEVQNSDFKKSGISSSNLKSETVQNEDLNKSVITSGNLKANGFKKSKSRYEVVDPTKRGSIPDQTDIDIIDTLNSYAPVTSADNSENVGNKPQITAMGEKPNLPFTEQPIELHPTKDPDSDSSNSEVQTEPVNSMPSVSPSDQKEDSLSMSPLASSISESSISGKDSDMTPDDLRKEKLDPAALGLLAEVFGKLTRLIPTRPHPVLKNASVLNIPKNNTEIDGSDEFTPEKVENKIDNSNPPQVVNVNNNAVQQPSLPKPNDLMRPSLRPSPVNFDSKKLPNILNVNFQKLHPIINNKLNPHLLNRTKPKLTHSNNLYKAMPVIPQSKPLFNMNKVPLVAKPLVAKPLVAKPLRLNYKKLPPTKHKFNRRNITASLHRSNINGKSDRRSGSLAKEYINILRADPPECTDSQMVDIMKYRGAILTATLDVRKKQNAGMFLVSCLDHSLSLFDETWTSVIVNGKTIAQAFGDWYYGRPTKHFDIDCPYPCNPSCP